MRIIPRPGTGSATLIAYTIHKINNRYILYIIYCNRIVLSLRCRFLCSFIDQTVGLRLAWASKARQ